MIIRCFINFTARKDVLSKKGLIFSCKSNTFINQSGPAGQSEWTYRHKQLRVSEEVFCGNHKIKHYGHKARLLEKGI
jgi:hypothetical protein